jgi:hypothetical protein
MKIWTALQVEYYLTRRMEINKFLYLTLLFICLASCNKNSSEELDLGTIKTYSSPSAYYGKPISRIYTNPYDPYGKDYYFDHDQYYVPPRNYGISTDNYTPKYKSYPSSRRIIKKPVKRYRYTGRRR